MDRIPFILPPHMFVKETILFVILAFLNQKRNKQQHM